jgi:hypothetical protein
MKAHPKNPKPIASCAKAAFVGPEAVPIAVHADWVEVPAPDKAQMLCRT